jgi:uncharacterized protein with GYD domain
MSTFVLMTKLTPEVTREMKHREQIGKIWMQAVNDKVKGIKWIAHYALLGPYDFMDIFEAPDEDAAAKVSMITLAAGAMQAESWVAIPYHHFLDLANEL